MSTILTNLQQSKIISIKKCYKITMPSSPVYELSTDCIVQASLLQWRIVLIWNFIINIFISTSTFIDRMGGDHSAFEIPLYPQPNPICATEPRFCLPHYVQLRLREKFWSVSGNDYKICDATDKTKVYFQCEGRPWSMNEKRILVDEAGVPVCNMKVKMSR